MNNQSVGAVVSRRRACPEPACPEHVEGSKGLPWACRRGNRFYVNFSTTPAIC